MLKDALLYPWDDGDAGTTLVAGGLLTLVGVLVLPALVVLGYWLRVVDAELDGDGSPPAMEGWADLLVDGAKAAVVLVAYLLAPFVVGFAVLVAVLGAFGFRTGRVVADPGTAAAVGGLALVGFVLLGALVLLLVYVAPAALVLLAGTGELRRAFEFGTVRSLVGADAYASAWLVGLVIFVLEAVALAVLNAASIGVVVSGFVGFYGLVATGHLYARGAREAGLTIEVEAAEAPADEGDGDDDA